MTPFSTPHTSVDLVFSFDTTGSMYPCLTQVRRRVRESAARLFRDIPGIRVGITAHGDYCDAHTSYVTRHMPLSPHAEPICAFVETVGATGGGDAPECYELVLREARTFAWRREATKVLVLIGDDVPHPPAQNPHRLNWRDEVQALADLGVVTYGVQALGRRHATPFYQELARLSGGYHLTLDQFSAVTDLLLGICYRQAGEEQLTQYADEVQRGGRLSRSLARAFGAMLGRLMGTDTASPADLRAVHPSRFQVLDVDSACSIREFVEGQGLAFRAGRGFYEFTKAETIQSGKEIVLVRRDGSGQMFSGPAARDLLGLPHGETARMRPTALAEYRVFVQSTSYNRKLVGGTGFLYEVEDWEREEGLALAA